MFKFEEMRNKRRQLGISQQRLADRMREHGYPVVKGTIVNWEHGRTVPPVDALRPLAKALQSRPVEFF